MTDPTAIVWGLFTKLEAARDLPDREVDAFYEAAVSEIGTDGLLSGWAIVAAVLRKRLIEHSETLGCDCGGAAWLQREQLRFASRGDE